MKKIICFDIDGTLATMPPEYLAFVTTTPKNWDAFFEGIPHCAPIEQTVKIYQLLNLPNSDVISLITTARPEKCRGATSEWLFKNYVRGYQKMYMRPEDDRRPDYIAKKEILEQIKKEFGTPWMVFDDRKQVLDMWQENGIWTFDVSQGKVF